MAAFILISKEVVSFDREQALATIREQTGAMEVSFTLGMWDLYLFGKASVVEKNYRRGINRSVFATGTVYLPGLTYRETLDRLLDDAENGRVSVPPPCGFFFILEAGVDGVRFRTDEQGIYSIFHTSDGMILSNSFLGLCHGLTALTLSSEAVVENLATGSLTGDATIFSEIRRFDPRMPFSFRDITFIPAAGGGQHAVYRSRKESMVAQADVLDRHFAGAVPFINRLGLDCGITGGYDSRLLFALVCRHFDHDRIQFHSFRREKDDDDFLLGREVCATDDCRFVAAAVRDTERLTDDELETVMYRSMLFNDGQVRTHAFWHEELNTALFRRGVIGDKHVGFSGIGGEQYRNSERMIAGAIDMHKWIDNSLIGRYAGTAFTDAKTRRRLVESLADKINRRIGQEKRGRIDLMGIKRYMNEIYIPANRGVRCNNENKISFFLMPFADPVVASAAYGAVPYLGASPDYEGDLITMLNPQVAALPSVYGYPFTRGEPVITTLSYAVLENLLPWWLNRKAYEMLSSRRSDRWRLMRDSRSLLGKITESLSEYNVPLDYSALLLSKDLGPLVFAHGYLLWHLKEKIKEI